MNLRKFLQQSFTKISPNYRRLMHLMHKADVAKKQQEMWQKQSMSELHALKERLELIENSIEHFKGGLDAINGAIDGVAGEVANTRSFIQSSIDITKLPKSSGPIRDVQNISLDMLYEVDRICKKHKLQYWLDFGTLLGAVRHKGFVPWDDDLDIAMIGTDYDKLLDVIDEELSNTNFRFMRVPAQIGKVVHKDFMPKGNNETANFINWDIENKIMFALDICPYYYVKDNISDDELRESIQSATDVKIQTMFNPSLKYENFYAAEKVIDKLHDKLASNGPAKRLFMGLEVLAMRLATRPWVVDVDTILPLSSVEFEGGKFPAPQDVDMYLIAAYGDYMRPPRAIHKHISMDNMPVAELKKLRRAARREDVKR